MARRYGSLEERFWAAVEKNGPVPEADPQLGPCWIWTAGKSHGYGILQAHGKPRRAHQVSWELHVGPIPVELVVRHKCDVRACVNPSHLQLGTRSDNNWDTHNRGRWTWVAPGEGKRRGPPRKRGPEPQPIEARFWPKVDKTGPVPTHAPELGPCWLWVGGCHPTGYGMFFMPGRHRHAPKAKAHRVSYTLAFGAIPEGLDVLHRCDVPGCVNPSHLYLGTDADNARDRRERGREPDRRGVRNGRAKLTDAQVAEIRARYTGAWGEQTALATEYGVGQAQISNIVRGTQRTEAFDGASKAPGRVTRGVRVRR